MKRFVLARARSVRHALDGVACLLRTQPNAWIHALATAAVVAAGVAFEISAAEWCALVLAITAVWTAEAFNTAVELLGDAVTRDVHPLVGTAKDLAAAAVLLAACGAAVVAALVFGPRLS